MAAHRSLDPRLSGFLTISDLLTGAISRAGGKYVDLAFFA